MLQERLPTRVELWMREAIQDIHERSCEFCLDGIESIRPLFINCVKTEDLGSNSQLVKLEIKWMEFRDSR